MESNIYRRRGASKDWAQRECCRKRVKIGLKGLEGNAKETRAKGARTICEELKEHYEWFRMRECRIRDCKFCRMREN